VVRSSRGRPGAPSPAQSKRGDQARATHTGPVGRSGLTSRRQRTERDRARLVPGAAVVQLRPATVGCDQNATPSPFLMASSGRRVTERSTARLTNICDAVVKTERPPAPSLTLQDSFPTAAGTATPPLRPGGETRRPADAQRAPEAQTWCGGRPPPMGAPLHRARYSPRKYPRSCMLASAWGRSANSYRPPSSRAGSPRADSSPFRQRIR